MPRMKLEQSGRLILMHQGTPSVLGFLDACTQRENGYKMTALLTEIFLPYAELGLMTVSITTAASSMPSTPNLVFLSVQ